MAQRSNLPTTFGSDNRGSQIGTNFGNITNHFPTQAQTSSVSLLDTLFLTDPDIDLQNLRFEKGDITLGTCKWILKKSQYLDWLNSTSSSLWITGGPGKGKTMLSMFIVDSLKAGPVNNGNDVVIYFFCSYKHENQNHAIAVLRGLLYQLLSAKPYLSKYAAPYLGEKNKEQTLASFPALWSIFLKIIQDTELDSVFCVIDGIDECEESSRHSLLKNLFSIFSQHSPRKCKLKLLGLSRDINGPIFTPSCNILLDDDGLFETMSDIALFINSSIVPLHRIEDFDKIRDRICTTLHHRADGTFLWVNLVISELEKAKTCVEIDEILERIPDELPELYAHMLSFIAPTQRKFLKRVLMWIAMTTRPLTLSELAAALGLSASKGRKLENIMRDYLVLGGPLIQIIPKGRLTMVTTGRHGPTQYKFTHNSVQKELRFHEGPRPESPLEPRSTETEYVEYCSLDVTNEQLVVLVHPTVRDFLLSSFDTNTPMLYLFRFDELDSHALLAQTCLEYISTSLLQQRWSCFNTASVRARFPFLNYAAMTFIYHAVRSTDSGMQLFNSSHPFFSTQSSLRLNWWLSVNLEWSDEIFTQYYIKKPANLPMLHMAAWSRMRAWIDASLSDFSSDTARIEMLNSIDDAGNSPLYYALMGGRNDGIAKYLLDMGSKPNVQSFIEAFKAPKEVLQMLVKLGNVNLTDERNFIPLHCAISLCNLDAVQILLDGGADVNKEQADSWTALDFALMVQQDEIVKVIVKYGVRPEIMLKALLNTTQTEWGTDESFVTILDKLPNMTSALPSCCIHLFHYAIRAGLEETVKLMIRNGFDVHGRASGGTTALHLAIGFGQKLMTEVLLARGAALRDIDTVGRTTLCNAALHGNDAGISLLLDTHADINALDDSGRLPLIEASRKAHTAVVRLLLRESADVNKRDKEKSTALKGAAQSGSVEIVELLLQRNARVNDVDGKQRTAFHYAARLGHKAVMNVLLKNGADGKLRDEKGKTGYEYLEEKKLARKSDRGLAPDNVVFCHM